MTSGLAARSTAVYKVAMTIASVNPATGETLRTFEPYDEVEVERRLALADSAFRSYRRTSFDERARLVRAMADVQQRVGTEQPIARGASVAHRFKRCEGL